MNLVVFFALHQVLIQWVLITFNLAKVDFSCGSHCLSCCVTVLLPSPSWKFWSSCFIFSLSGFPVRTNWVSFFLLVFVKNLMQWKRQFGPGAARLVQTDCCQRRESQFAGVNREGNERASKQHLGKYKSGEFGRLVIAKLIFGFLPRLVVISFWFSGWPVPVQRSPPLCRWIAAPAH